MWPRVIQKGLDEYTELRNNILMRKQTEKPGPSGMSRDTAFSLPELWGGRNCLLPVDVAVVEQMKADMGGDALIAFSTPEFTAWAEEVYDSLGIQELTKDNVWDIFTAMLPLVFPNRM